MYLNDNITAYKTILIKEILRFSRIWLQTIIPPAITMGLYFIIFGQLIGSQLSDIDGYSYMDYIVPGLIIMSIISNSYSNVVSSFYGTKFHHHIEELLVSPIANITIIAGYVSGGVARGLTVGIIVTLVSMFFIQITIASYITTLFIAILTATLFSLAGLINAIFANSFDDISIVPTFVLTPLTYLGGVFYSIEMLPEFWHNISLFNPVLYMVNGFRMGMLGVSDASLATAIMIIIGFIILLTSICLWLLNKGIGIKK
ncbi:MAG: ABC transporter permease [gamma proteobacterium symbiont of Lucinoma myriamae]|nr:ABC transporter permease [gamma proteobacterium symbiont of Lucinoma myriamae]MCU7817580.1 ABC transporter permease [gamma proteobacterium symbiont of Lucinoma myriamae]MCU7832364.1 ABC transporter permease [gamma proteobacterium symbiont of Lucinoma myriamae]